MSMKTGIPEPMEREIQKSCLDFLSLNKIFAWRQNSGFVFSERKGKTRMLKIGLPGCPDIIGISDTGRFFGIEVKRKSGKQSDLQKDFEKKCREKNGLYFLVNDLSQMEEVLRQLKS